MYMPYTAEKLRQRAIKATGLCKLCSGLAKLSGLSHHRRNRESKADRVHRDFVIAMSSS
jgi:hypothetical protein